MIAYLAAKQKKPKSRPLMVDIDEYYPAYRREQGHDLDEISLNHIFEVIGADKDYDYSSIFTSVRMRPIANANGIEEWTASRNQCEKLRELAFRGKLRRPCKKRR